MRYVDGEPVGAGRIARRRVRQPRHALSRVPVARRRRQRGYYDEDGAAACARRSCARRWSSRASRRASRRRASIRSCRRGARTRASTSPRRPARRCARPATASSRSPGEQNGYGNVVIAAARQARTRPCTRTCRASPPAYEARRARAPGRRDRLRRPDRLGDRPAPALRVPHRRRAAQSADRRAADGRCRSPPSERAAFARRSRRSSRELARRARVAGARVSRRLIGAARRPR